jgi:hypothetical protein
MLFGVVGSLRLDSATPMRAAPTIWTTVAMTSQVMKIQRMVLGGRGAWWRPVALMRRERMV